MVLHSAHFDTDLADSLQPCPRAPVKLEEAGSIIHGRQGGGVRQEGNLSRDWCTSPSEAESCPLGAWKKTQWQPPRWKPRCGPNNPH